VRFYSRKQLLETLGIDEGFVVSLEREEILQIDGSSDSDTHYSERMLERARVAYTLVHDLDVNLEGAAIIVRLREEIADLQSQLGELARRLKS
jgi:hypothetical protein